MKKKFPFSVAHPRREVVGRLERHFTADGKRVLVGMVNQHRVWILFRDEDITAEWTVYGESGDRLGVMLWAHSASWFEYYVHAGALPVLGEGVFYVASERGDHRSELVVFHDPQPDGGFGVAGVDNSLQVISVPGKNPALDAILAGKVPDFESVSKDAVA
ncbi:MAG: hypothetical protein HQM06_13195 [Magnetococcales bacterium]|nr:hypothetical protein [Magnetococcales bacterium]